MTEQEFRFLGQAESHPTKELDTFARPAHVKSVQFTTDEVTSFCPVTGQPDFNRVEILYAPDALCLESKSLKLYLWTFRDEAIFGEALAATIAQDLYEALQPYYCQVTLVQSVRGGLQMTAVARVDRDEDGQP